MLLSAPKSFNATTVKEAMMRREMISAILHSPALLTAGGMHAFKKNMGRQQISLLSAPAAKRITGVDMVDLKFKHDANKDLINSIKNNPDITRRAVIKKTLQDTAFKRTPVGLGINKLAPHAPGVVTSMFRFLGNRIL